MNELVTIEPAKALTVFTTDGAFDPILKRIRDEKEASRREANKAHRAKINNTAVAALVGAGLSENAAKAAVTAIAKGDVPNVTISY
jgi:Holliday junction resolvasome RuvABC DNA-binding subunit